MRMPVLIASFIALVAGPAFAQGQAQEPFRVFFDWGKPELTRDAEAILNEVVAAYRESQPDRVTIAGHTDRSGSSAHNLAASGRRAQAVKAYLAAHGIPAGLIKLSAYGESQPFVPTEDGVREAQNRRVEISFERARATATLTVPLFRGDSSATGTASLTGNSLTIVASGLAPGLHGLHLHAVGRCDGPDFASAGPHWNPAGRKHGSENPEGPHDGDLPNLQIGANGRGSVTMTIDPHSVDSDGVALVIHASPDDYRTDPSGNSGARIACAAFTR